MLSIPSVLRQNHHAVSTPGVRLLYILDFSSYCSSSSWNKMKERKKKENGGEKLARNKHAHITAEQHHDTGRK